MPDEKEPLDSEKRAQPPYLPPISDYRIEEIEGIVLETEFEAKLADERQLLEDMGRKDEETRERLSAIKSRIQKLQENSN